MISAVQTNNFGKPILTSSLESQDQVFSTVGPKKIKLTGSHSISGSCGWMNALEVISYWGPVSKSFPKAYSIHSQKRVITCPFQISQSCIGCVVQGLRTVHGQGGQRIVDKFCVSKNIEGPRFHLLSESYRAHVLPHPSPSYPAT